MTAPVETGLGRIRIEQCDHFGHLNIQHYSGITSDAFLYLMTLIGLGKEAVATRRLGLVATSKDLKFRREMRAGDLYRVDSAFLTAEPDSLRIAHRITRLTDDKLALIADVQCVPLDLDLRRRTEMPADLIAAARGMMSPAEAYGL